MEIVSNIKSILTAPLNEKLDPFHLFLIVGLVIVSVCAWMIILRYMEAGISTIAEEV